MKKILFTAATLGLLVACNNKNDQDSARQATLDSVNMANNHQRMLDSMTAASSANQDAVVIENPTIAPAPVMDEPKKKSSGTKKTSNPTTSKEPSSPGNTTPSGTTATSPAPNSGTNTTAGTGTVTEEEKKKKGLNNAAKGAIIGLGTGAAAGAVINKENRGKGAVIGGVIGAVGGAVGGAVLDKRKAKKEAEAKDSTDKK